MFWFYVLEWYFVYIVFFILRVLYESFDINLYGFNYKFLYFFYNFCIGEVGERDLYGYLVIYLDLLGFLMLVC